MIPLGTARAALEATLTSLGYNVTPGDTVEAPSARVGLFTVAYHRTIGEGTTQLATTSVRVIVSRADEASATAAVDDVLSTLWGELERAFGPWHALVVTNGQPDVVQEGQANYAAANLTVEVYV